MNLRNISETHCGRGLPRRLLLLVAAIAGGTVLLQATSALAASSGATATATGSVSARIVRSLAATTLENLDFGVIGSSGAGTVIVAPGDRSPRYTGAARRNCAGLDACPTAHAARFSVRGESGRSYRIAVPDRLAIVGGPAEGPARGLLVVALVARSASRPGESPEGTLDHSGQDTFEVGGTLSMPSALPPAHYTISVPVIVTYS